MRPGGPGYIKKQRTADCVGGYRNLEKRRLLASLPPGLCDDNGLPDHVGYTPSIRADDRGALTNRRPTMIRPPGFTGKTPGGMSRWSTKRSVK